MDLPPANSGFRVSARVASTCSCQGHPVSFADTDRRESTLQHRQRPLWGKRELGMRFYVGGLLLRNLK